ncbi:hypothetical protein, partial [Proteus mirabilis]|uniref:hypothetical protein n=1 Tax=Proteus mirabilis TaxID=584 RepID=UPI00391C106A
MVKVWSGEAWQGQTVTTTQDIIGQFILFKTTWGNYFFGFQLHPVKNIAVHQAHVSGDYQR